MRQLIDLIETASNHDVSSSYVLDYVAGLNNSPNNRQNRKIASFERYNLEKIDLAEISLGGWYDEEKAAEYSRMGEAPPIVYDAETKTIIDGYHRVHAAILNGEKYIMGYVGYNPLNESVEPNYSILYHCSPRNNFINIGKNGLDPSFSKWSNAVYLAADELHAQGYDQHHQQKESVMLAIDVSQLDKNKFGPDDVDLPDCLGEPDDWVIFDWSDSLKICGQCCYHGIIPPSAISYKQSNVWIKFK